MYGHYCFSVKIIYVYYSEVDKTKWGVDILVYAYELAYGCKADCCGTF